MIGDKIGFSDDGVVFLASTRLDVKGRAREVFLQWKPEDARKIAGHLVDAADEVDRRAGKLTHPPYRNFEDGDNDGTGDNKCGT